MKRLFRLDGLRPFSGPFFLLVGILFLRNVFAADQPENPQDLSAQIAQLREKISKLESALDQKHQSHAQPPADPQSKTGMAGMGQQGIAPAAGTQTPNGMSEMMQGMGKMMQEMSGMMGMGGMGAQGSGSMQSMGGQGSSGMGKMGMMDMDKMSGQGSAGMQGMGAKNAGGMAGMSAMGNMEGMSMMGMASGGNNMSMISALPGFPGASHIYHIGATGFFLDHAEHLHFTNEQQTSLNKTREASKLEQATLQRKIEQLEQELWTLTASDKPDAKAINEKIAEIENARGQQRMAFIRAVGEAAKVLTEQQREILTGVGQADKATAAAHSGH